MMSEVPDSPVFDIAGENFSIPDDPPEYEPDEEPLEDFFEDFPYEETRFIHGNERIEQLVREHGFTGTWEGTEHAYERLLDSTRQVLREENRKLHQFMMAIPELAASDQWKELDILTGHLYALIKTIGMYRTHAYPPWRDPEEGN